MEGQCFLAASKADVALSVSEVEEFEVTSLYCEPCLLVWLGARGNQVIADIYCQGTLPRDSSRQGRFIFG